MPSPINAKASPALRGQSVTITLDPAVDGYPEATWINAAVSVDSSSKTGTITSIDINGVSFKVTPVQPNLRFDSASTPGILALGETINFLP